MSEASTNADEHKQEIVRLEICPYGDMQIVLKTTEIYATYQVSSHQLCSASPVFRAMLGPNSSFAEAVELRRHQASTSSTDTTKDLFEIVVEDHDPAALGAVLYVIHGRSQFLPDEISFKSLMEVAIVVDYYDCAEVMRPWDEKWMKQWMEHAENPGYENWLFIAWVFKVQQVFGALTKTFSRKCARKNREFMVNTAEAGNNVKNWKSLDYHIPQKIIDAMWKQRCVVARGIFTRYRTAYSVYSDDEGFCLINWGRDRKSIRPCSHLRFAALHKGFKAAGIPMKAEKDFDTPENLLDDIVRNVKEEIGKLELDLKRTKIDGRSHEDCISGEETMLADIEDIIDKITPLRLKDFLRRPMTDKKEWEELLRGDVSVGDIVNQA